MEDQSDLQRACRAIFDSVNKGWDRSGLEGPWEYKLTPSAAAEQRTVKLN